MRSGPHWRPTLACGCTPSTWTTLARRWRPHHEEGQRDEERWRERPGGWLEPGSVGKPDLGFQSWSGYLCMVGPSWPCPKPSSTKHPFSSPNEPWPHVDCNQTHSMSCISLIFCWISMRKDWSNAMSGVRWWLRACEQPSSSAVDSETSVDSQWRKARWGRAIHGDVHRWWRDKNIDFLVLSPP